jgi:hypothetical protein
MKGITVAHKQINVPGRTTKERAGKNPNKVMGKAILSRVLQFLCAIAGPRISGLTLKRQRLVRKTPQYRSARSQPTSSPKELCFHLVLLMVDSHPRASRGSGR